LKLETKLKLTICKTWLSL